MFCVESIPEKEQAVTPHHVFNLVRPVGSDAAKEKVQSSRGREQK